MFGVKPGRVCPRQFPRLSPESPVTSHSAPLSQSLAPDSTEKNTMKGFRSFLLRGNVVDLAVGIVIGAAFTAVVNGFVTAFLTPIVGLVTHSTGDFTKKNFSVSGVTFPYGALVSALISFVLIAIVVYYFVVMPINRLHERFFPAKEPDAHTKDCPECLSTVPAAATRCSFCTIPLTVAVEMPKQQQYPEQYPKQY